MNLLSNFVVRVQDWDGKQTLLSLIKIDGDKRSEGLSSRPGGVQFEREVTLVFTPYNSLIISSTVVMRANP
ncbi:hypothetical protein KKG05_04190, partial [bacterium]|nr:hypothetical protein [bacterium]